MLELYSWNTPNGYKVPILLEELGLPYAFHPIDIHSDAIKSDSFTALNQNQKIPVLVDDSAGVTMSESGAILIYLAEKHHAFLSEEPALRATQMQWLMFQMSAIGPMFGQANHFLHYAPEQVPYAIARYTKESERLMCVIDAHLATHEFLGTEYSIADIAMWPWIRKGISAGFISLDAYPSVARWYAAIESRPAVARALEKTDAASA